MEVRRTVPVTLDVDSADTALLEETIDEFLRAAQYVTDHAVQGKYVTTSKTTLNDETYVDVREATRLHSNHVQSARNKAADACNWMPTIAHRQAQCMPVSRSCSVTLVSTISALLKSLTGDMLLEPC